MVGWIAGRLEWWVLWLAAADEKGIISKEKVRISFVVKSTRMRSVTAAPDSCDVRWDAVGHPRRRANCEARLCLRFPAPISSPQDGKADDDAR